MTGDQSITDAISCCKRKTIWYQIAPWKKGFAYYMYKNLPNENFKTFKTSCGSINAFEININWTNFQKNMILGPWKKTHGSRLLIGASNKLKKRLFKNLLLIIDNKRFRNSAKKKSQIYDYQKNYYCKNIIYINYVRRPT